jgi:hypothetical protein
MATGISVIFSITNLASSVLTNVRSQINSVASGITQASTALFFWSEAFNQIKAASSQFYGLFVGQNEKMRQQILATQSSLAAVQDVYMNGIKLADPTAAIQAFEAPIRKSLNQIAVESLDLVGITSGQLTDLLQIALTNATKITNQSKDFADPIKAAERLTLSFAGAFGAMQIPLFQARQEINSILSGTIDMNSRLAKGLSITNDQVRSWGSQGILVDKLINKLQPFIAGNALAARSVSGITSNIQEILEITTRLSGENLTALFVDGLDVIYQYMKAIQPEIQATLNGVTGFIVDSVKQVFEIISPFLPALAVLRDAIFGIGGSIGEIIGGSAQILLNLLTTVTPILSPVFDLLASIVKIVADLLGDPVIQQMVQMALIITTVIGPLTTVMTLVTTIYGLFATGGSLSLFLTTMATVAPGLVASLSTLGTALLSIAGFGGAAGTVAASGSMMAALGGAITSVAVALAPLAAAIAAVASAALLWQSLRLGDADKALRGISLRSDTTAKNAGNTAIALRDLQEKEIIQGELTDNQKADKKKLQDKGRNYGAQLEAEIAAAKAIDTAGNENLENAKKSLIEGNERSLKALGKYTSGLSTSAKPLTELGGIITQTEKKVAAFEAQIKAANSDPEFQTANKGIIDLITKQVQLGQITAEQGKKRLRQILDDSRVEIAGKEAAQKAISQIQEITTKKELDRNKSAQSEIEAMQNDGRIGEVKAEQLLTEEKLKEVKIRSDAQKIAHTERMRQIQAEMNADLGVIDKQIADKQATLNKLKAAKAPEVQVVQAQRDLDASKAQRTSKQLEYGAIQTEENRKNAAETTKLEAESAKLEKQQRDVVKREALKDFDERQKINDSAREQGLKDNQQAAIESVRIAEGRANAELGQIKEKTTKLEAEAKKQGKTVKEYDKEAWEALQVQQAEALQKLAAARKEGLEKRLSDIKQDAQEATALVEAAQAKNDIDNQQAAVKTAMIATKSINNQIALIDKEIVASKGNVERLEELNAKKAGLEKDLTEVQKKELQQRLADLQQDADERVAVIKAANATGAIDNQQTAIKTAAIEMTSSKGQLKLIQNRIAEVVAADKKRGKVSVELLEDLRKQEADTQVKITEITKKEMDARLADLKEDAVERTAVVKAAQATGEIDNQAAAVQTANIERTGAAQRLEIVRKRIEQVADEAKKSGKLNVELMESLKKQEADIQVEMTEIDKKEMESRLGDLQQDADERVAVVAAANALGAKDNQEAAIATSQIQQKSANDQLKIVQDRIKAVLEEGKKTGKVNVELLEELRKKEADIQVKITEIQKQELQKRLADLREDAEERTAVVVAANATGVIDNQQSAVKIGQIQRSSLKDQLTLIQERISTANPKSKELLEDLRKQEAEVQTKITESQKQELDKRIKDLEEDINERTALVESANASGLLDNQQAAIATERIQEAGTNKQIALIQKRINEVKAEGVKTKNLNTELLEELQTQEANAQKKLIEIRKQAFQKRLSDLQQDSEEELAVVNSLSAQGVIDNQKAATQSTEIQQQSLMSQLRLIKERLSVVGGSNKELNEELLKQQAELQIKLTEVQEQGFQKQLSDLQQDGEELLAIIVANNIRGLADNQETAIKSAAVQEESAQQQLMLIQERLGQASGELREKLLKLEADTQVKITEIQKQAFDKRLADMEQDGQEQLAIVNSLNAQGIIDNQKAANQSVDIQQQSLTSQVELIKERLTTIGGSNKELGEELLRQEAELQIKLTEVREQSFQKQLSDLQQDGEERLAIVASNSARGLADNQEAATKSAAIQEASAQRQLTLIRERLNQVSGVSIELREKLLKLEADTQTKITEIQKQELQKRLADLQEDSQQRIAVIEAANALGVIDNQESAKETENIQKQSINQQLQLVRTRIAATSPLNQELNEELKAQEAKLQKELTEIQEQSFQKQLSDLQQDGEEWLAIIMSNNARGLTDNQETAIKSAAVQEESAQQQLMLIQERLGRASGELREKLLKLEADTQAKITEIQKQELQKRLSDLQQDSQERTTVVEAAAAIGTKDNQESAAEIENIQRQSVNEQLNLVRERIAATSPLNQELNEELKAQEAKLQKELTEIQGQGFQKRLSDLQQDGEERLAIIIADGIKGLTDNQETASKSAAIQEKSAQQQLNLIRDRLTKTGALSIELRESLLKQEADTEAKIIEIRKQAFDKQLADIEQDGQERQTVLDGQLAQGRTTEAKYAEGRYTRSVQSLDAQLALIRERRSQISATDIEGQEALAAQEATLQSRRQEALMQFLDTQLSLLDRENKKATDILEQSELDRRLIIKRATLLGIGDRDAAATAEIQAAQRRIQQEIAMEEQKNVTLRSLSAFSDPAKEAERQSRIRASIKKTTELRLQLLDEESKAFNLLIDRQIKGIQNQSRTQELASDAQVRSIEQQGKQYDLLSRSLENQNKLLQSRASLSNALASYIQGEYKILQDSAGSEGERNRLKKEAADAQLIAMQQQQVVAQKNLDIEIKQAEIAQKRAEFEAEIAEIKARAGSAKADAEVRKAEVALQKVRRDPNASNADIEAAKLDVVAARASAEAAVAEIAYAIANKDIVGQNGEVLKEQNNLKRETLSIEQATQGRAGRATAIEAIVDPREKELSKRELAGRLTSGEAGNLARIRQENRMREETQRRDQAERDALAGKLPASTVKRYIRGAETRSASLLEGIKQASTTPPEVPELPKLIAQMNMQRKQITAVKPEVNPLIRLQEESTGYQKEMLGVLKQINGRPAPAPVTPVANNFNIKAESGISEAQVLGMFGQVSQQVTQMLKR